MRVVCDTDIELDDTAGDEAAIREIADALVGSSPTEILAAIHERLRSLDVTDTSYSSLRRGRHTSSEMLAKNFAWGCSAHAQIACHLARARGIPSILVKTIDKIWLSTKNDGSGRASGHVYVEVLLGDKPALWDAQGGVLHSTYDPAQRDIENRLIYDKGAPDSVVLSHHGTVWEDTDIKPRFHPVNLRS